MSAGTDSQPLPIRNKVGLIVAGLLGAADITGPSPAAISAAFHFPQATGEGDPFSFGGPAIVAVAVAGVGLGLATMIGVVIAWVKRSRVAARIVAAARVISVLLTSTVFLLQGLEAWIFVVAAALVILNITAVILVLSRPSTAVLPAP